MDKNKFWKIVNTVREINRERWKKVEGGRDNREKNETEKLDRKEEYYEEMKKINVLKEKEKESEIVRLINRETDIQIVRKKERKGYVFGEHN